MPPLILAKWMGRALGLMAVAVAVLLSACSKPADKAEIIRPVRALVLAASSVGIDSEFSGEVRRSFEHMMGESFPDRSWQLAQRIWHQRCSPALFANG